MIAEKKKVFSYILLPGLRPRFRDLFAKGFAYIPFFIALVYQCVRLLPKEHPYTDSQNIGRFGLHNVISEAANNLELRWKNIDQILLFGLIIVALCIMVIQLFLLGMTMFIQTGFSFPSNYSEFFVTSAPQQDIAHIFLDMIFGIPDMFNSCISMTTGVGNICQNASGEDIIFSADHPSLANQPLENAQGTWPYPVHDGLHKLFEMYSYGLLIIAMMITLYFMVTVVAETAQSGTPFGKRFNKVWAPLRIVLAFGLLVPISNGLNSGQYIVLHAAKYGSGFATNGWNYFNTMITTHYFDGVQKLVAVPNFPESQTLLQFYFTAATCKTAYETVKDLNISMYVVGTPSTVVTDYVDITTGPVNGADDTAVNGVVPFANLMSTHMNGGKRIVTRYGVHDKDKYPRFRGNVKPFCGEVTMDLTDPRLVADQEKAIAVLQSFYWFMMKKLWMNNGQAQSAALTQRYAASYAGGLPGIANDLYPSPSNPSAFKNEQKEHMRDRFFEALTGAGSPDDTSLGNAIDAMEASNRWIIDPTDTSNPNHALASKGWAGAAIWYNRIAEMNGAITSALFSIPMPTQYPYLMEFTSSQNAKRNSNLTSSKRFKPDKATIVYTEENDAEIAQAMYNAYEFWDNSSGSGLNTTATGNIFIDSINAIFGTNGLFDMRKNADVHPLAQLASIGKSLVENSIRNIGFAAIGGTTAALRNTLGNFIGGTGEIAAEFMISVAMIGLTMGFVLYYVVPFLPFIYFFFAVGGWIKGIFEAMVGVPLWALAHIRIDGEGLSGQAAIAGYFLVFEIFLRPILIIFGFLASILVFSAMVQSMNTMFDLVTANVGGFDMLEEETNAVKQISSMRNAVDQFSFTIIYAIVVYMMGQSSFKLIDLIPNNILRWMGQSISTFNDSNQNPAESLVSTSQMGAQQALNSVGGGMKGLIKRG